MLETRNWNYHIAKNGNCQGISISVLGLSKPKLDIFIMVEDLAIRTILFIHVNYLGI